MSSNRPKFLDSPHFVGDPNGWRLKPGAPEEVKKEFSEFMLNDELGDAPEVPKITLEDLA